MLGKCIRLHSHRLGVLTRLQSVVDEEDEEMQEDEDEDPSTASTPSREEGYELAAPHPMLVRRRSLTDLVVVRLSYIHTQ